MWRYLSNIALFILSPLSLGQDLTARAAPAPAPLRLSLKDAVRNAVSPTGNADARVAEEAVLYARGKMNEDRSQFLPQIGGQMKRSNQLSNLASQGIAIPGAKPIVDFNTYDARVTGRADISYSAIERWRASEAGLHASRWDLERAQDRIAGEVAQLYYACLRGQTLIAAAEESINRAQKLLDLAVHRLEVGNGTSLDVTRARAQLMAEEERRMNAQNERTRSTLELLKAMGRPLDTAVEFTDALSSSTGPAMSLQDAIASGRRSRPDLKALQERIRQTEMAYSALVWDRLPTLVLYGDDGPNGTTLNGMSPTHTVGAGIQMPFFLSGRIYGRQLQGLADMQKTKIQFTDLWNQVELEVREAMESLGLAIKRVEVAGKRLALGRDELAQAKRLYEAGVQGNLDVVEAQTHLAEAEERNADALFDYQKSSLNLWVSAGIVRTKIE